MNLMWATLSELAIHPYLLINKEMKMTSKTGGVVRQDSVSGVLSMKIQNTAMPMNNSLGKSLSGAANMRPSAPQGSSGANGGASQNTPATSTPSSNRK